jgi:hypothetical protein
MTAILIIALDSILLVIVAVVSFRRLIFVAGGYAGSDAAEIIEEYRNELRSVVRAYRWLGLAVTACLALTASIALWQIVLAGNVKSLILATLGTYVGVLGVVIRMVFRRVDLYEGMYRETLPLSHARNERLYPVDNERLYPVGSDASLSYRRDVPVADASAGEARP